MRNPFSFLSKDVGIDLGTTNSALAYTDITLENNAIEMFDIPQFTAASTLETRKLLPSFLYIATENEAAEKLCDLPWHKKSDYIVGEFSRLRSAEAPARTVSTAKSWLCHNRIDRRSDILPWNAPDDVKKISPLETSKRYLEYIARAWNEKFKEYPFNEQIVTITVPASFDASGRELTREAAINADYPEDLILIEEPVAALYSWLSEMGEKWRKELNVGDTILVCDVGGGTTDFSLISVKEENGNLILERTAVGNHILVGGDNMDLALAHYARNEFEKKGLELDAWQAVGLWHSCRTVKEIMLSDNPPDTYPVAVLGRGSKLIGGTVSIDLKKSEVLDILTNGFFPDCNFNDKPARKQASGFREIGLPYESDTAVSKHLAYFLNLQKSKTSDADLNPTYILFNGGAFKAEIFRNRIIEIFSEWFGKEKTVKPLAGMRDYDFAVARGASYYAMTKQGKGIRIRGGTARSYYVGIETSGPAVPGLERPMQALCVVPFGMEEGSEIDVPSSEIGLIVGEKVQFRFFSSSTRKEDKPGDLIPSVKTENIIETDSVFAELPASDKFADDFAPVKFFVKITELGTLELWCKSVISDDKWKLEFNVRED